MPEWAAIIPGGAGPAATVPQIREKFVTEGANPTPSSPDGPCRFPVRSRLFGGHQRLQHVAGLLQLIEAALLNEASLIHDQDSIKA